MLGALLTSLRPHQWVKNVFVLAPLVFAEHAADPELLLRAGIAFVLFSLLSGCVYLLNDIVDIEADRAHPTKCNRPIPSGRLPLPAARTSLALLLIATVAASFALSIEFAAVGMAYFTLNVGYSFALKHIPFLDVGIIATGFILRIFGGAFAIDVPISIWLGGCTFLLAVFLGLGKRKHELALVGPGESPSRRVLQRYSQAHIQQVMILCAVLTTSCYLAYTLLAAPHGSFTPRDMLVTVPFVVFGLARFHTLTNRTGEATSPTDAMLADWPFLLNVAAWGCVVIGVIYVQ